MCDVTSDDRILMSQTLHRMRSPMFIPVPGTNDEKPSRPTVRSGSWGKSSAQRPTRVANAKNRVFDSDRIRHNNNPSMPWACRSPRINPPPAAGRRTFYSYFDWLKPTKRTNGPNGRTDLSRIPPLPTAGRNWSFFTKTHAGPVRRTCT